MGGTCGRVPRQVVDCAAHCSANPSLTRHPAVRHPKQVREAPAFRPRNHTQFRGDAGMLATAHTHSLRRCLRVPKAPRAEAGRRELKPRGANGLAPKSSRRPPHRAKPARHQAVDDRACARIHEEFRRSGPDPRGPYHRNSNTPSPSFRARSPAPAPRFPFLASRFPPSRFPLFSCSPSAPAGRATTWDKAAAAPSPSGHR